MTLGKRQVPCHSFSLIYYKRSERPETPCFYANMFLCNGFLVPDCKKWWQLPPASRGVAPAQRQPLQGSARVDTKAVVHRRQKQWFTHSCCRISSAYVYAEAGPRHEPHLWAAASLRHLESLITYISTVCPAHHIDITVRHTTLLSTTQLKSRTSQTRGVCGAWPSPT